MSNIIPIMLFILFIAVGSMILRTTKAQREFLRAYREKIDLPFPLSSEELRSAANQEDVPPTTSLGMIITTLAQRLRLYWGDYPKDRELNKLASSIRGWLTLSVLVFVLGVALIAFFSYNLSH
jgi:hypothetical protein